MFLNLEMLGLSFSFAIEIDIGVFDVLAVVFSTSIKREIIWRLLVKLNEHSLKPLSVRYHIVSRGESI